MMTAGIIGSGQIGSAIARLAIDAGHQVVLSNSRGPDTLAELGPQASEWESSGGRYHRRGRDAGQGVLGLARIGFGGKTVIDACNLRRRA
jgi:hypothetical protein